LFAAAIAIITRVWMIPEAINVVLLPRTSGEKRGRPELVAKCSRLSVFISAALIFILLILAKPLVAIVLSPKFLPVVPLMWIMALGVLVRTYPKIMASYFNGIGRPGRNSLAILAGLIVNLCLLPILFPLLGLPGAALTLSIAYGVEMLLVVYWFGAFSGLSYGVLWRPEGEDRKEIKGFIVRLRQVIRRSGVS
jgi:O-antigen/teichoic acid export membrane protein